MSELKARKYILSDLGRCSSFVGKFDDNTNVEKKRSYKSGKYPKTSALQVILPNSVVIFIV